MGDEIKDPAEREARVPRLPLILLGGLEKRG
jgi:hypothetical protein